MHATGQCQQQCRRPYEGTPTAFLQQQGLVHRLHRLQHRARHKHAQQQQQQQPFPKPQQSRRNHPCLLPAAAAAAADMGDSRSFGLTQPWGIKQLGGVFRPSKYDAELFSLAVPALAAMMLDPLMNVISAAVLGHLGTQQLGAVSLASMAITFSTYVFSFLVFLTTPRIAAAHANGDSKRVARLAAVGLWLAAIAGTVVVVGLNLAKVPIVQALRPPEPEVARYAVEYITAKSPGILAVMLGFVASGTYRGVKDTRTPLIAAAGAFVMQLVLTPLFIIGFDWGVWGAGMAATLSLWLSTCVLIGLMFKHKLLHLSDVLQPPKLHEVVPYLWKGLVLALRMVVTYGMVLSSSTLCIRTGAASQAAFEIMRQVWIITSQFYESLNVATQAMVAGLLGRGDTTSAMEVLQRALQLAFVTGLIFGLPLYLARGPVVGFFTRDTAVAALGVSCLPIVAGYMPLDAAASVVDGGLIAAGQTNSLSVIQMAGAVLQYIALAWIVAQGRVDLFSIWFVLKLSTVARLAGGAWVHFASSRSVYRRPPKVAPQAGNAGGQ